MQESETQPIKKYHVRALWGPTPLIYDCRQFAIVNVNDLYGSIPKTSIYIRDKVQEKYTSIFLYEIPINLWIFVMASYCLIDG